MGVTFTIVRRGAPVVHFTAVPIQSVIRGVYKLTRNPTSAISWPLLAPSGLWWQLSLSIYAGWVVTGGVNPETAGLSLRVFAVPWTVQCVPLIRYGHGKKGGEIVVL